MAISKVLRGGTTAASVAKRMECVQLAAAFDHNCLSKAAASCTHSKRSARFVQPKQFLRGSVFTASALRPSDFVAL
jgi:hypothetical protein